MLITVCSAKGSPGATSVALALCAAWPRESVTLLEADPTGGDLAFRCRHASGREVASSPNTVGLATAVRGGDLGYGTTRRTARNPGNPGDPSHLDNAGGTVPSVWATHSQPLACGVRLVPGTAGPAQSRGLRQLWPRVATAAAAAGSDVVADLGRVQSTDATVSLIEASAAVVVVCQPTLESVSHSRALIVDLVSSHARTSTAGAANGRALMFWPVVVGPRRSAQADAADIDTILGALGIAVARTMPVTLDPRALGELQAGADPRGRLGRTPLMVSATTLATLLARWVPTAARATDASGALPRAPGADDPAGAGLSASGGTTGHAGPLSGAANSATWELRRS